MRVDRQAGDLHLRGRHAETQATAIGAFGRDEAMVDARVVPERWRRDQIGDDGEKWRALVQRQKGAKRGVADDGMGADDDIGGMVGDDAAQDSAVVCGR